MCRRGRRKRYRTRAMESSRETHSIQNCLLARLGSVNLSDLRKEEGREEENRARTGTQRVITPRKGKCWLRPGFDSNWQNLFKCSLLTPRHQTPSTANTDTCTHTIKANCPPAHRFHCFLFGLPHSTGTKMSPLRTTSRAQSKNAASYMVSSWSKHGH